MEETPSFDAATERLQRFLSEQGWPIRLIWRIEDDIVLLPGSEFVVRRRVEPRAALAARAHYEVGIRQGVGIALEVPCEVDGAACTTVYWTTDGMEAQYRTLPEHGLKLSVATAHPAGRSVGTARWWLAARKGKRWGQPIQKLQQAIAAEFQHRWPDKQMHYWVESEDLCVANERGTVWRGRPAGRPAISAALLPGTDDAVVILSARGLNKPLGELKRWPNLVRVRPNGTVVWRTSADPSSTEGDGWTSVAIRGGTLYGFTWS